MDYETMKRNWKNSEKLVYPVLITGAIVIGLASMYRVKQRAEYTETVDDVIINGSKDDIDEHKLNVLKHKFDNESFNMFRLELSNWLDNNKSIKNQIISIVRNKDIHNDDKRTELRRILFDIVDPKLSSEYKISIGIGLGTWTSLTKLGRLTCLPSCGPPISSTLNIIVHLYESF